MPYGFNGKILRVDLSSRTLDVEEQSEEFFRSFMGGSALNLYYLLKEMPAGVDAFDPDNMIAFSVGVATGVPLSGQSRVTVSARSPLTNGIGDSQAGGFWPAKLKFAGFDAIIVKGRASSPVYLWVRDGQAEIRDASHLWGMQTGESQKAMVEELGDHKIEVLQIGPAGEQRIRYASILNMCNRANGRNGLGAVMGSKNLKAIVVNGKSKPKVAQSELLGELQKWGKASFPDSAVFGLGKFGTAETVGFHQDMGMLPTYNFNSGVFDGWEAIDGVTMYNTILKGWAEKKQDIQGRDTCFGCLIRCKRVVEIEDGPNPVDPSYGGPEYETLGALGSYCGIDDLPAIAKANEICNRYGVDTISCGATIAWAMEAFEAGVLTEEDTGGLSLKFGNSAAMLKLVEMIARREGFGELLGEGSARAADQLNRGREFLTTSKMQEAPAHMPQSKRGLGLIYAVNPYGSDHQSVEHDPAYEADYDTFKERLTLLGLTSPQKPLSLNAEKIRFLIKTQQYYSMLDSLNLCQFAHGPAWQLYGPAETLKTVKAVTGWDTTMEELLQVGERRLNMMRAFNAREGFTIEQDQLPEKFFTRPLSGGPTDGLKLDKQEYADALQEYYRQAGWDPATGIPLRDTLERLDLGWVAEALNI
jgi:aldehyde:ferredoxin oxidoreductase